MKRILLAAAVLASLFSGGPAGAQCPGMSGTLPGSSPSVMTIGQGDDEPYRTAYIDDRDAKFWSDIPEDTPNGIWVYVESNGWAGLQRGGLTVFFEYYPPSVGPIVVLPPDPERPVRPQGLTLFPGPGPWLVIEAYDECREYGGPNQPREPDTVIF